MIEVDMSFLDKQPTESFYYEGKLYRLKRHQINKFNWKLGLALQPDLIDLELGQEYLDLMHKQYIKNLRYAMQYLKECDMENRNRKSVYDYC